MQKRRRNSPWYHSFWCISAPAHAHLTMCSPDNGGQSGRTYWHFRAFRLRLREELSWTAFHCLAPAGSSLRQNTSSFFPSAPVFHKTNLYLRNNTPPAASAIAGWIAYFLLYRPAFDLSSGFSKFLSIPSAPDKIRFDSAIFWIKYLHSVKKLVRCLLLRKRSAILKHKNRLSCGLDFSGQHFGCAACI